MINDQFTEYMHDQVKQIELDKWFEGERIGHDPGQSYVHEWIKTNSLKFRTEWENKHVHT